MDTQELEYARGLRDGQMSGHYGIRVPAPSFAPGDGEAYSNGFSIGDRIGICMRDAEGHQAAAFQDISECMRAAVGALTAMAAAVGSLAKMAMDLKAEDERERHG